VTSVAQGEDDHNQHDQDDEAADGAQDNETNQDGPTLAQAKFVTPDRLTE
jgi:hypothetical protein